MNLFNNDYIIIAGMIVTAIIVSGIFIYTFYNKIFTGVKNIYTYLIINSLINKIGVVIFSVLIYTLYLYIANKSFFTIIYCSNEGLPHPENLNPHIRVQLGTFMHLHYQFVPPRMNYDIVNSNNFIELLFANSSQLGIATINGVNVYTITVNNVFYTIHPDLIVHAYRLYGLP